MYFQTLALIFCYITARPSFSKGRKRCCGVKVTHWSWRKRSCQPQHLSHRKWSLLNVILWRPNETHRAEKVKPTQCSPCWWLKKKKNHAGTQNTNSGGLTLKFWSRKHKWIHTSLKCHHILWKCTIVGLLFPPTQFLLAAFQDSIVLFLHLPLVPQPPSPFHWGPPQFQALPTSSGPASPDKCPSPDSTNGPHHPWCKINTIQRQTVGCFLDSLFSYKSSQQRTLQLGWSQ